MTSTDDGYPTDEALAQFRALMPTGDPAKIVDLLREHWHWPERVRRTGDTLELVTGGWSGNEEIIGELHRSMFWMFCWEESHRGGHYRFDLSRMVKEE